MEKCDAGDDDDKNAPNEAMKAKKEMEEELKKSLEPKKIDTAGLSDELRAAQEAQAKEDEKQKAYEAE